MGGSGPSNQKDAASSRLRSYLQTDLRETLVAYLPSEERRRQFVHAAVKVIATEGVAKATTRRIAEVAGTPTASLHYCFESKDELFQAVFQHGIDWGQEYVARDIKPGIGLHTAVEVILRGLLKWTLTDPRLQQAQYELVIWALRNPESRHLPGRMYRGYAASIEQLLEEARGDADSSIDVGFLARHIIAVLDGHVLQWLIVGDEVEIASDVEASIKEIQTNLASTSGTEATVTLTGSEAN